MFGVFRDEKEMLATLSCAAEGRRDVPATRCSSSVAELLARRRGRRDHVAGGAPSGTEEQIAEARAKEAEAGAAGATSS